MTDRRILLKRMKTEPLRWYARFLRFAMLKNALAVYREEYPDRCVRSLPGYWRINITKYQWRERLEIYEDYKAAKMRKEFMKEQIV
jgi:hypothetical protein